MSKQPLSPKSIANYFLNKGNVNPMKLQKLVYYAHAWHLAIYDGPLINEAVEAWQYGPVIPSLYHEFKHFGNNPITSKAQEHDHEGDIFDIAAPAEARIIGLLDKIWEVYGKFTAVQLSNLTHKPDNPWSKTVEESKIKNGTLIRNLDIPNDLIKEVFKGRLE